MDFGIINEQTVDLVSTMHEAGVPFGKSLALFGIGFSLGKSFIKIRHKKGRASVAIADVIRDVIIFFILGYLLGAVGVGDTLSAAVDSVTETIAELLGGENKNLSEILSQRLLNGIQSSGAGSSSIVSVIAEAIQKGIVSSVLMFIGSALIGMFFALFFN